jgi:DNA-directed RNA polymerase specialized sigma24 family protein
MSEQQLGLVEFLLKHKDELLVYLARRLGSAPMAEDVLRETLVLLHTNATPPTVADPRAYLFAMATHLGIDRLLRECAQSTLCHQLNAKRWDKASVN